jgi:hypothetical protein
VRERGHSPGAGSGTVNTPVLLRSQTHRRQADIVAVLGCYVACGVTLRPRGGGLTHAALHVQARAPRARHGDRSVQAVGSAPALYHCAAMRLPKVSRRSGCNFRPRPGAVFGQCLTPRRSMSVVPARAMATTKMVCFVRHGEARCGRASLPGSPPAPAPLTPSTPPVLWLRARTTWLGPSTRASTSTRSTLTRT